MGLLGTGRMESWQIPVVMASRCKRPSHSRDRKLAGELGRKNDRVEIQTRRASWPVPRPKRRVASYAGSLPAVNSLARRFPFSARVRRPSSANRSPSGGATGASTSVPQGYSELESTIPRDRQGRHDGQTRLELLRAAMPGPTRPLVAASHAGGILGPVSGTASLGAGTSRRFPRMAKAAGGALEGESRHPPQAARSVRSIGQQRGTERTRDT